MKLAMSAGLASILVFGTSCVSKQAIVAGDRSGALYGNVKIYGTDNVPFEYEEVGVIGHVYHKNVYSKEQFMREFVAEAQQMGADAILDFKIEPVPVGGGVFVVVVTPGDFVRLTGVAVKIKRP
jgi:hypothetical protein